MEKKSLNPKSTQKELAKELGYSTSSLQRYSHDINMLSLYRIPTNSHKRRQKISNREHDLKRSQKPSNNLKRPQLTSKNSSLIIETVKPKKNKFMGFGNIELNDEYFDEYLHNSKLQLVLAMQIFSNDQTVRSNRGQDLKEYNSQTLATQAKKGEKVVAMMPDFEKVSDLMGDDIVELRTKNGSLENKIGSNDEQWLEESKTKLLKQIDHEKRANLVMSRMRKQSKNIK